MIFTLIFREISYFCVGLKKTEVSGVEIWSDKGKLM